VQQVRDARGALLGLPALDDAPADRIERRRCARLGLVVAGRGTENLQGV